MSLFRPNIFSIDTASRGYYSIAIALFIASPKAMTENEKSADILIPENELWLTELIRGFMEHATKQGKVTFPPPGDILWHILMYETHSAFPCIKCLTGYDWDGPYPKKRDLDLVFFGLYSVTAMSFPTCRLKLHHVRDENILARHYPFLAKEAFAIACNIPGFFEE